ncbi:MAG: SLC13 family permease [Thermoanaerobaculia bacterium]|nr:MAG: SLC13 family permease [Thermoanaerobaculia bacterium]MBZ0101986.1 SLC13 family permease [Thermoanaerobaculia bacterium]
MSASVLLVALLLFMLVAAALEWMAVEVVALVVLATLLVSGQISLAEATQGFSDPAVLTVLMMMVLSEAISESGVVAQVGHRITRWSGGHTGLQVALLFGVTGVLSMFINNTAAVAMFIPVAIQLAKQMRASPSRLLLPLNYSAIVGGTCTLIGTSTNILVSSLAADRGLAPFSMFEFLRMGIFYFAAGMAYNLLLVRRLPDRGDPASLTGKYQLATYLTEVRVPASSPLVGRTVVEARISDRYFLNILEIQRDTRKIAFDLRSTPIEPGDALIVRGSMQDIVTFKEQQGLLLLSDIKLTDAELADQQNILAEMQLSPASTLEGMSLREIDFRRRFGAFVLALSRAGESIREKLGHISLRRWDTLLVFGPRRAVEQLYKLDDFLPLQEIDLRLRLHPRWWLHGLTLVGVVVSSAVFGVNILTAALVGVVLLLASRTVKVQRVYRSVQWSVFFLLAATIPLGGAVEKSGLADHFGRWLAERGVDGGPWVALSLLYLATMILTEMLSNASTAVLMLPVALSTAAALGVDPKPMVMAITFAASNGFVTPIGYQTNAMVYGAGNYRYGDFLKAGIPLNLMFWGMSSLLIPVFWPF